MVRGKKIMEREPARDRWNRSLAPERRVAPLPVSTAYMLRVPLGPDHWIMISSNKEMRVEDFRVLNRYLCLQRELLGEDDLAAQSRSAPDVE